MTTTFSRSVSLLACGALALSLAACSSPAPEENEGAACDAYGEFATTVDDARASLSASSTIEEITAARDEVQQSYEKLQEALVEVNKDRDSLLEDAWADFDKAINDIDPTMTVPDAVASLQEEVAAIEAAKQGLDESLTCS
ncbi:hypothetical protein ACIFOC_01724 [Leucobacter aridicollis]|uniref:hypothetical protein n=1 Tax=Leucobacter aridicollis TaxID=283878 RepID=UPI002169C5C6|nr:hypothetical protein [Leucobacter aridicollis]MCS3428051.1 chromosome segregation ATPase [Leucobacter aridicollis]